MSALKPTGVPITLDGVERHILFTLNAIDEIQERFDESLEEVMKKLLEKEEAGDTLRVLLMTLINDEVERLNYKDGECKLETVDEKQIGWMLTNQNILEATIAVMRAYGYDLPEPEEDDPNQKSGQQKK